MSRDVVTKSIGDRTYEFYQMSPKVAVRLLARITKLVGEPLGIMGGGVLGNEKKEGGSILDQKFDPDLLPKAARIFCERLDEDQVLEMIDWLLAPVLVKTPKDQGTRKLQFEIDMQGRIGHLMAVVIAALEVNYSDFFYENSALAGLLKRMPTNTTPAT